MAPARTVADNLRHKDLSSGLTQGGDHSLRHNQHRIGVDDLKVRITPLEVTALAGEFHRSAIAFDHAQLGVMQIAVERQRQDCRAHCIAVLLKMHVVEPDGFIHRVFRSIRANLVCSEKFHRPA